MLNKTEAQIAETLFHKLMHNTLFLKNQLQFNENLASFFGKKASIYYLNFFHGHMQSKCLIIYLTLKIQKNLGKTY